MIWVQRPMVLVSRHPLRCVAFRRGDFFFSAAVMTWVPSLMVVSVGARFAASYFAAVMIRASGGSQTGVDRVGVTLGPLLSRTGRGARFAASYFAAVMIWAPNPMDWSSKTA